jgi:predicted transposase/invertase (TIGR01784 family)
MQVLNVAGLEQRLLYNLCKAYVNQLQQGEHYHLLTSVVAVTVTDFVMFGELSGQINRFVLVCPAGHTYLEVKVLYRPGKGNC